MVGETGCRWAASLAAHWVDSWAAKTVDSWADLMEWRMAAARVEWTAVQLVDGTAGQKAGRREEEWVEMTEH
jgi:hypothetical protein